MTRQTRRVSVALLLLGAMALGALTGSGCAMSRGDRSTVQPLALDKKQFEGEWYYQKTVIDAPFEVPGFVFRGATSNGYKMRWEITERFLFAYTVQPNVRNTDSGVAPIMAWPIVSHFTVRYGINYATGEPSNVIVEDMMDKPWYQRPHFRVVWERQAITDFSDFFWIYQLFGYSSMLKEMSSNVRPEEVQIQNNYMDIVTEDVLSPSLGGIFALWGQGLHLSSFRIRNRSSFRKVTPSNYTPLPMTDGNFENFGFFRTAIINYNVDRGLADWSYQYYTNRHNVASQAELDRYAAENTPEDKRKPKHVIYYLSPNFPKDMEGLAYQIMDEWDLAFKRALGRVSQGDRVVLLRPNDYELPKGQRREMGDIRYNMFYWVNEPISFGLLGYGPSFADPDTGEIISCSAYVYGGAVKQVANRFLLLYDMVRGAYTEEDLRNGKDYLDIVNNLNPDGSQRRPLTLTGAGLPIMPPAFEGLNLQKAHSFVQSPLFGERIQRLRTLDRAQIQARLARLDDHPSLRWAMMPEEVMKTNFPNADIAQLQKSPDEHVQKMLNSYLNPANIGRLSALRQIEEETQILSKHNMYLESYVDPAMTKFIQAVEREGLPREQLIKRLEGYVFYGTQAHEVGHTLGLRHNFEASADETNYFKEYNDLKAKQGENVPGDDKDPRHRWFYMYSSIMDYHGERYGDTVGLGKYDQAAIMYGYGERVEISDEGLATSQANLSGYFDQIEAKVKAAKDTTYKDIFKEIRVTRNNLTAVTDTTHDLSYWKGQKDLNGNAVPPMKIMEMSQVLFEAKGVKDDNSEVTVLRITANDMADRDVLMKVHSQFGVNPPGAIPTSDGIPYLIPEEMPLKRHRYRFCSDELVGQSPYCNRFDSGSNPMEIVDNMIRRYDGNYPLTNWNRGRRFYRLSGGYLGLRISQFRVVSDFFQNWIFRVVNENNFQGSPEYFNQLAAIQRGLSFINRVLATPEPGRHAFDADKKYYAPSADPNRTDALDIPVGVGRYFYSKLQQDEMGLGTYRFERIGTLFDKYIAMMTLAIRDWGLNVNRLDFFFVNFSDFFSQDDVYDIFTNAISGVFDDKFTMTYEKKQLAPNWHPLLQYEGMFMAMALINSGLFGNSFTHYMTVGYVGSGSGWTAPPGSQSITFTNAAGTRMYYAVQTSDGRSIAWKLVERGKTLSEKIRELRGAQPTSAVIQAELQEKEAELRQLETVIVMMGRYVNVFYE